MSISKQIKGYEGLYEISSTGEIKSTNRILKPSLGLRGYYQVSLYNNGKKKSFYRYKLIAMHFIPNPHNYPCNNHKDGNKLNDSIENLEWCTFGRNVQHAYDIGLKKPSVVLNRKSGSLHPSSKSVIQKTLTGIVIKKWDCIRKIQKELGFMNTSITNCLKGRSKYSYGFKWVYENQ